VEVSRILDRRGPPEGLAGRRRRKDATLGPHAAVGDRLRQARRAAGLTMVALATKIGGGRSTLVQVERGVHLPRARTLHRIAEATGVTTGWLLTGVAPREGAAE
jgi:ribosome-binding protein aMBF1 (putative translation factor)